ncbi:hypothetical protein BGV57_03170 [Burkholderia ubonensis]|uniref:hypothetical protein n=1 Tax=Burkholderia ubonensis TaxID=101571 RepID=UPI0008FEADD8|nr:hypothetical protein [Burkholderia ubonensis]OJB45888.1 hypothetical protein BGV57_03170 [Burkholderia ubonensis]
MALQTAAQKRKFVKDLIKNVQDDVMKRIEHMPADWDGVELRQYIGKKFENEKDAFALRGNTARGRAFNSEISDNRHL